MSPLREEFGRLLTNALPHVYKTITYQSPLSVFSNTLSRIATETIICKERIPRLNGYPFLLYGSTLLRHINIRGHTGKIVSSNLSGDFTDYFPTILNENNEYELRLPFLNVRKELTITFFEKLWDILIHIPNYAGCLIIESDVSELFQDEQAIHYAWRLAYSFIHLLAKIPNLPKKVIILGSTPHFQNNFINSNGIGIQMFNSYLRYLAYHHNFGFIDPSEILLSHRRHKTITTDRTDQTHLPTYTILCVTPPSFPMHVYTQAGELTINGLVLVSNYLNHVASKIREISFKLGLRTRYDVLD